MLVCIFRSWSRPQYCTRNFLASEPSIHDQRPQSINIPTCRTTRAHFNATLEQYEILDVMPPDEYQKRVNNSATTKYSIYVQVVYCTKYRYMYSAFSYEYILVHILYLVIFKNTILTFNNVFAFHSAVAYDCLPF